LFNADTFFREDDQDRPKHFGRSVPKNTVVLTPVCTTEYMIFHCCLLSCMH